MSIKFTIEFPDELDRRMVLEYLTKVVNDLGNVGVFRIISEDAKLTWNDLYRKALEDLKEIRNLSPTPEVYDILRDDDLIDPDNYDPRPEDYDTLVDDDDLIDDDKKNA